MSKTRKCVAKLIARKRGARFFKVRKVAKALKQDFVRG